MSVRGPIPKVSRTSLVDEVIAVMRQMLSEEAWSPGTKLPSEQELGRQLGVGRSTVREALRVLGHLGVVESRSGLGTYVVDRRMPHGLVEGPDTPKNLRDLYEFRRMVEIPAARLAAEHRDPEHIKAIKKAWKDCSRAVEQDSAEEFARLDYVFHFAIVQASQNRFLINAYQTIETAFPKYVNLILALGPLRSMLHFHDGLIAAIERGDADSAEREVRENYTETDVRLCLFSQKAAPDANERVREDAGRDLQKAGRALRGG